MIVTAALGESPFGCCCCCCRRLALFAGGGRCSFCSFEPFFRSLELFRSVPRLPTASASASPAPEQSCSPSPPSSSSSSPLTALPPAFPAAPLSAALSASMTIAVTAAFPLPGSSIKRNRQEKSDKGGGVHSLYCSCVCPPGRPDPKVQPSAKYYVILKTTAAVLSVTIL